MVWSGRRAKIKLVHWTNAAEFPKRTVWWGVEVVAADTSRFKTSIVVVKMTLWPECGLGKVLSGCGVDVEKP